MWGKILRSSKFAELEIHRLNDELERRVIERTAQLRVTNQELETFAYSVSHDLRAPLRTIDGFSLALLEDYSDSIDAVGKKLLERIQVASKRMGVLIDGLLKLSRTTRGELHYKMVDLSKIADQIAFELRSSQPERSVEFMIQPDLWAYGDENLLRLVVENLLGNAWKFTRYKENAEVIFGQEGVNNQDAFYVKDDGVGFDMAFAGGLFGAFQRLHSEDEFEGNGIGLATVQRIIHRHGGRVWADAEMDRGATFYFTLGKEVEP